MKPDNGEFPVSWECPACTVTNTTRFHPDNGPWVTLRCACCGDDQEDALPADARAAVTAARGAALQMGTLRT